MRGKQGEAHDGPDLVTRRLATVQAWWGPTCRGWEGSVAKAAGRCRVSTAEETHF